MMKTIVYLVLGKYKTIEIDFDIDLRKLYTHRSAVNPYLMFNL